jgi:hypothetical protein
MLFKMEQLAQSRLKSQDENLPAALPESRYQMSVSTKEYGDINTWISDHSGDPGYEVNFRSSPTVMH